MNEKAISILTGWGDTIGAGHAQRMSSLADYLRRARGIRVFIVADADPQFLPAAVRDCFIRDVVPGSTCVIRDCRDSSADEMLRLKTICPVIAIDDCGPGREHADLAIDLLPNQSFSIYRKDTFIFGYNFTDSIRRLGSRRIEKKIDIALYCGMDASPAAIRRLVPMLPGHATTAVLAGENSYYLQDGIHFPLDMSVSETLAASKVLFTHFGITLFEGHAAGCRLVCVNPTQYHAELADRARADLDLINLGVVERVNPELARASLAAAMRGMPAGSIDTADILRVVDAGLDNFHAAIVPLLA
jgi:hypothetical protein